MGYIKKLSNGHMWNDNLEPVTVASLLAVTVTSIK